MTATPGNAGRDDYPRMVYHPDGRTRVVATPAEENGLLPEGWQQTPTVNYQRPRATPSTIAGISDPLATMFRNILEQVLDERGVGKTPQTDVHAHLRHSRR